MENWNNIPFENLLIESRDGEWGKGEPEVGHSEAVAIRGTDFANVNDPQIALPHRWIKDHLVERKKLQPGDIVFEMAGGTSTQSTGRSALLKPSLFENNAPLPAVCASFSRHLRIDNSKFSSEFVYFLLQSLHRSGYMGVYHIQHTGVARFQYSSFKKHTTLKIPDLPTQRKIAAILTAYDDLIETNKRRIALLEQMAEELYREWFVRMRFPGHQNTEFVKGVPEGWDSKTLPELADISYGFPFQSPRFNTEGLGRPIIRIRNIPSSSTADYTDEEADDKYLVNTGDLIVGMDGEFHMNHWYGDQAFLVQRVCRIKEKDPKLAGYLALAIRAPIKHFEAILACSGATVGHLGAKHLKSINILIPPQEMDEQMELFNNLFQQKLELSLTNRNLTQTRDLLLPRLISGKLSVEDLDIQFPPSMQTELHKENE